MEAPIFFSWLISTSFMASITACIILVLKVIFEHRLSAQWHYSIWFLLVARLALPSIFTSPFSIFNIYRFLNKTAGKPVDMGPLQTVIRNTPLHKGIWQPMEDYTLSVSRISMNALFFVWVVGVIYTLSYISICNISTMRIIKGSKWVCEKEPLEVLEKCKENLSIRKNIPVIQSYHIKSPALFGLLNPRIILPAHFYSRLSSDDLRYIFFHELIHYKNRDILVNLIICIIEVLHWFNPIVWYGFKRMRQDRELACDAAVLELLNDKEYYHYGTAIIKLLESTKLSPYAYSMAAVSSNKALMTKRINRIVTFRKESKLRRITGFILSVLLSFVVLTNSESISYTGSSKAQAEMPQNVIFEDLDNYFQGYDGSFVLLDANKDIYYIYNEKRSRERVSPCSTYKIISSLIGLETGRLRDKDTKIPWDGIIYPFEPWSQDHTLETAFSYSVDWYFEKFTDEIERDKIMDYMKKIGYGNSDISGKQNFWQESSLKISPIEQVDVLLRLYKSQLPFSQKNIDTVKHIMKVVEMEGSVLSGKTGTGIVNGKSINGWYIGYLERGQQVYIFAVNIQGLDNTSGQQARDITMSILTDKGFI
ncbi:BlaR1 family beta-lactam sensor/signal transducer [Geosporobacter ferrireducens]|uniref:BlaR1 family beta-lactam sensor/signal transducer n=1 Tax=Geosporobacter ferrireducens TaxID=1424294 RepID=A0A1D8GFB3_9FIRM|nr:BlaR1 family beta-lactam sensor/signal transducer [Geosporobacter ferrireducens]AOT69572.1 hypothetical protein Gferi_08265 [Geosporobacter ferrireducens]MTI54733.1 BlaR1 family beta-lactam sensor/signal transducer [Geosporobacter ferrireducens]